MNRSGSAAKSGEEAARRRREVPRLLEREQARFPDGVLPWREFMRLALYDPQWGYYSARIPGVGPAGDFTTAPALHDGLARAVLRWAADMRAQHAPLRRAPLLEVGAGAGPLAAACLAARPWRETLQPYGIVEVSEPLRRHQEKLLRWRPARWFSSVGEALQAFNGTALIFSNELVDAFPCSVWRLEATGWREWGLRLQEGKIIEKTVSTPLPDSSIFAAGPFAPGQHVETHETWRDWMQEWTPCVRAAALLTIDYGGEAPSLYRRRPEGSLRAYWRHQRLTGAAVRARFGQQDLTADVNFSDLRKWTEALGWQTTGLNSLREFLPEDSADATDAADATARQLRDPAGAGEAFWALQQTLLR